MVSSNGIVEMFETNARTTCAYFLHVPICDVILLMDVEKDLKPSPKIFEKLEFGF